MESRVPDPHESVKKYKSTETKWNPSILTDSYEEIKFFHWIT